MTTAKLFTNCIALINGRPGAVRDRLREVVSRDGAIFVSTSALFELWYGVAKSAWPDTNADRLAVFLALPEVLPFDDDDARAAGAIRAALEAAGTPIGAYDTPLAGQAVRRGLTLVTATVAEFGRVAGLRWEDWSKTGG